MEFVRFCYRRRRVGWPELYDEMCAVAGRGLFRGWGTDELSDEGIAFTLFEMPALAALVQRIVAEDHDRRPGHTRESTRRTTEPGEDAARAGASRVAAAGVAAARTHETDQEQEAATATLRLAHAGA